MAVDRRKLFALGGLGALGAGAGTLGPEVDLSGGITIRIWRGYQGQWVVAVPDFDGAQWRPGEVPATKGMPIAEYLAALDGYWTA